MSLRMRLYRLFGCEQKKKTANTLRDKYPQHEIGKGTYGDLTILFCEGDSKASIGAFCSFGPGVQIFLGGEHRTDWVTTYPFNMKWQSARHIKGHPKTKGDVIIGNDVWIGAEVIIMSGVNIGDGAVIATRALVAKDVPAYSISAGNPARVVRMRFDDKTISSLLEVRWWDWDDATIEKYLPLMLSTEIDVFIKTAKDENFRTRQRP
jgi:chloramphenicol O-acetyltransferase type B